MHLASIYPTWTDPSLHLKTLDFSRQATQSSTNQCKVGVFCFIENSLCKSTEFLVNYEDSKTCTLLNEVCRGLLKQTNIDWPFLTGLVKILPRKLDLRRGRLGFAWRLDDRWTRSIAKRKTEYKVMSWTIVATRDTYHVGRLYVIDIGYLLAWLTAGWVTCITDRAVQHHTSFRINKGLQGQLVEWWRTESRDLCLIHKARLIGETSIGHSSYLSLFRPISGLHVLLPSSLCTSHRFLIPKWLIYLVWCAMFTQTEFVPLSRHHVL